MLCRLIPKTLVFFSAEAPIPAASLHWRPGPESIRSIHLRSVTKAPAWATKITTSSITPNLIADHYGTHHHECIISPATVLSALPGIIAGLDQPSGDAINTYLVAGTLPDHIHTVLTGTGGDEIFIGSHWFKQQVRLQNMNRNWLRVPARFDRQYWPASTVAGDSIRHRLHRLDALRKGVPAQYRHFKFLFDGSALEHLVMPDLSSASQ